MSGEAQESFRPYIVAEDSPFRENTRTYYRNLGRTTLAIEGSYDSAEGGILGHENVPLLTDMVEDERLDALTPGIYAKLRSSREERKFYREQRASVEASYVLAATDMLETADRPSVPLHIKTMIQQLQPGLWKAGKPLVDRLTFPCSLDLIRGYRQVVEAQRLEVMGTIPQWRQEAFQTLKDLGADDTALKAAKHRLESSQVHFVAPLEYYTRRQDPEQKNFAPMAGDCNPQSGVMRILLNKETWQEYEGTAKHEYMHSMSSHAPKVKSRGDLSGYLCETRIGLGFYAWDKPDKPIKENYTWLNEGVTQALAIESATRPPDAYQDEVELLDTLAEHMDVYAFLDAYLEPVDPSLPASERSPHLKKMVKLFHDTYGPGSLRLIDDYITAHGGLHTGTAAFLDRYKEKVINEPEGLARQLLIDNHYLRKWQGQYGHRRIPAVINRR